MVARYQQLDEMKEFGDYGFKVETSEHIVNYVELIKKILENSEAKKMAQTQLVQIIQTTFLPHLMEEDIEVEVNNLLYVESCFVKENPEDLSKECFWKMAEISDKTEFQIREPVDNENEDHSDLLTNTFSEIETLVPKKLALNYKDIYHNKFSSAERSQTSPLTTKVLSTDVNIINKSKFQCHKCGFNTKYELILKEHLHNKHESTWPRPMKMMQKPRNANPSVVYATHSYPTTEVLTEAPLEMITLKHFTPKTFQAKKKAPSIKSCIVSALDTSKKKMLTLNEIFEFFVENCQVTNVGKQRQNAIRTILSVCPYFIKVILVMSLSIFIKLSPSDL